MTDTQDEERAVTSSATPWLKSATMIVALAGWAAVVAAYLLKGELPDPILLGVPGGLWLALHPPRPPWQRRAEQGEEEEE